MTSDQKNNDQNHKYGIKNKNIRYVECILKKKEIDNTE